MEKIWNGSASNIKESWPHRVKRNLSKIFKLIPKLPRSRRHFPQPWIVECARVNNWVGWLIAGQEELIKIHAWLANPSMTVRGPQSLPRHDETAHRVCNFFQRCISQTIGLLPSSRHQRRPGGRCLLLMDTLIFLCFSLLLMIYADHKGLGRLIIFIQTYPQKFQPFHASLFQAFLPLRNPVNTWEK